LVALSAVPAVASAQTQDSEGKVRHVVILNATDPYLPAFIALDGALRKAIRAGHKVPVQLHAETLDMHRFQRTLLENDVVALLRKKYRGLKVDVVVTVAPIALDFAQRHRAEIWPGAAIVFHSVPAGVLDERSLDARTIGVPARLEFGPTLDLALKLRPATRRIAVVAGTAEPDRRNLRLAQASLERYAGRLDIQYLAGLTLAETLAAVRALPSDAVVLHVAMFRDGAGEPQVPRAVLMQVAAASRAPVFGVFDTYLGHGIVAGSIASFEAQGRRAGELVVRVLNGEDPATIGVQAPVASGCIADWRELQRWGISESRLPADCEVRFKEVTPWERHRWQIITAVAIILVQTFMIIALVFNRRGLRLARVARQDEYDRRRQAEATTFQLRARLARFARERSLGTMATTIAHEVNQPLIAIQNYAQAAQRRLESSRTPPKLLKLCEKIRKEAERAGAITQHVRALVSKGEPELRPVPLYPLLQEVIGMMEAESEARGCRVACEAVGDLPAVLADALQVQLVLVNLLNNAQRSVEASEASGKRIVVDVCPLNDREVQVSVTDEGPGVPPERVADIFEPLYSGTSTGLGMGLAICRDIIDAHGGRIWYEPNPRGGAIFRFTLRTAGS
jgi:signal transduction histidine kinase